MTSQIPSLPTERDLPPGRMSLRAEHLVREITSETHQGRLWVWPVLRSRAPRFAGLLAASSLAALGAALFLVFSNGSPSRSALDVRGLRGSTWTAAAGWGGHLKQAAACVSRIGVMLGCQNALPAVELPAAAAAANGRSEGTTVVGGTPGQEALLQSILAGVQPNSIGEITISGSPNNVTLDMAGADDSLRTLWEESLVAAAFRDRSSSNGQAVTVSLVAMQSAGILPPGPSLALPQAATGAAALVRQRVGLAAARAAAPIVELDVYQPDGIAFAVTLKTSDPAAFLRQQMPTFLAALGDRWRDYDGTYIRLVDGSGATVWETSSTGRLASGAVASTPALEGCSPVANWGPTASACPAG